MGPSLGGGREVEQKIISVVLVGFSMQSFFFSCGLYRSKDFAVVSWANKWITFQLYKRERQTSKHD